MRLPRRVPWQTTAELEQLCSWIFTDENDLDSRLLAINKLSAWKAITVLPHALESTLAILSAIYQDGETSLSYNHLSLRQSYATAIIRLVNGLVDPLQVGVYARSIGSLAAQLGISPWLVELRHAATHEDLPSLEVLRESARQSMVWLLHNYFLPSISPSTATQPRTTPIRPLEPILKSYKNVMKTVLKDASLAGSYKSTITGTLRDVERWIAEAKVASGFSNLLELETQSEVADDAQERFALEKVCEALLQKGGLIPLSKSKRSLSESAFEPVQTALDLWNPLISHVDNFHPDFKSQLAHSIVNQLFATQITELDNRADDITYTQSVARWAFWAVNTSSEEEPALRREVVVALLTGLGPTRDVGTKGRKAARDLLDAFEGSDPSLKALMDKLIADEQHAVQIWDPSDMQTMTQRLETVLANTSTHDNVPEAPSAQPTTSLSESLPGWRPLNTQNWKPCPIGIFTPSLK